MVAPFWVPVQSLKRISSDRNNPFPSMKSAKNGVILLLFCAAAALGLLAWRQYQELVVLRSSAMRPSERADFRERAWEAQRRIDQLEKTLIEVRQSNEADLQNLDQNRAIESALGSWVKLMGQPQTQALLAAQQRINVKSRYAGLFAKLKLPPEQLSKLEGLLADRQLAATDAVSVSLQKGVNPLQDPGAFQAMVTGSQAEVDQQIKETLGESSYSEYSNYLQTQGLRSVMHQIQESLSYGSTPLSSDQSAQLSQIIAQTGPAPAGGSLNAGNLSGSNPAGIITDETLSRAKGLLFPPQLDVLEQIQQGQQAKAKMNQLLTAP